MATMKDAKRRIVIGIDPGQSGGFALYDGGDSIEVYKMPETYPDVFAFLRGVRERYYEEDLFAVLEDVGHGMPGQSSAATAKFARHNGHLEMALYALGIRTEKVTPQKWQKAFSNSLGRHTGVEKREWKNKLKALAQQMFPSEKVTLNTADAILIAVYGSRK